MQKQHLKAIYNGDLIESLIFKQFIFFSKLGENSDSMLTTGSNFLILSNGSLLFESISKKDEGMYKCNVSNGIGIPLTKEVMIKVIGM